MKERPILMSAPMVRALLDGSKSQTRRSLKIKARDLHSESTFLHGGCAAVALGLGAGSIGEFREQDGRWFGLSGYRTVVSIECPYGQPGDRLWVRETFRQAYEKTSFSAGIVYRADAPKALGMDEYSDRHTWKPSIFMPRAASRITLEITDVRVERLQSISEVDARAEGIHWFEPGAARISTGGQLVQYKSAPGGFNFNADGSGMDFGTAVEAYGALWENINGPGSLAENPWVWVIAFKRVPNV